MRASDPSKLVWRRRVRCRCFLVVGLALVVGGRVASAHSMSVTGGVVTVTTKAVIMDLSASGHDLMHDPALASRVSRGIPVDDFRVAAQAYADRLAQRLIVRGPNGEPLSGAMQKVTLPTFDKNVLVEKDVTPAAIGYVVRYALNGPAAYISFQQLLVPPERSVPTIFALLVRSPFGEEQAVRLTSGGNVAVVPLGPPEGSPTHQRAAGPAAAIRSFVLEDAYDTVRAVLRIADTGVILDTYIPVPVVETWLPLPRQSVDFLQVDEQDRAATSIKRWCHDRQTLDADGTKVVPDRIEIAFLDVGRLQPPAEPKRISTWTTRVRITQTYRVERAHREIKLTWRMFNNAVLTAEVLTVRGSATERHEVSTYAPTLVLRAPTNHD